MSRPSIFELSAYTKPRLADVVHKCGFKRAMQIRREMQVALADAAQKGSDDARLPDFIQADFVQRIGWIEKWCRLFFVYRRVKELSRAHPGSTLKSRKRVANEEWQGLCRELSY